MSLFLLAGLLSLLAAVAVIDARRGIIPDLVNLALALLGALAVAAEEGHALLVQRAIDAAIVGLLLLLVREAHRRWSGVVGLGLGDVKFLAAATLWLGLDRLFVALLAASIGALVFVAMAALAGRPVDRRTRLRFGPFLALAVALTVLGERALAL